MNKIEELIKLHCPNGVEFRELGDTEYFKITMGQSPDGKSVSSDNSGLEFHQGKTNFTGFVIGSSSQYTSQPTKIANPNSILMSVRAPVGAINYTDRKICIGRGLCAIQTTEKIESMFLYYVMQIYGQVLSDKSTGSTFDSTNSTNVKAIKIPIPPIPVQQEIVKILDRFIELETELELQLKAELEARKKQYDFYRSKLLSFSDLNTCWGGVSCSKSIDYIQWKTLGEIAEFKYGFTDKAKEQGNVRFVRITDINENGKLRTKDCKYLDLTSENEGYLISKGDLLMARTGATFGKTMLFNEEYPAVYASFLIRIRFRMNTINPSFYWHFAQSALYWEQTNKLVSGGAQPQFNANALKLIKIPIPPLAEQERIVGILDKFDKLVNNISEGLPAEIKARKKQYEYYRGQLLNFKPLAQ